MQESSLWLAPNWGGEIFCGSGRGKCLYRNFRKRSNEFGWHNELYDVKM